MGKTQTKKDIYPLSMLKRLIIARITILLHLLKTIGGDPYAVYLSVLSYLFSPDNMLTNTFKKVTLNVSAPSLDLSASQSSDEQSTNCLLPGLPEEVSIDCFTVASRSTYPVLRCINKTFKSLISSGYLYKLRQELGIEEHWIYVSTNLIQWEAFDPIMTRWMPLPRIPCNEGFKVFDKESLAVGTRLLVFGREASELTTWMYNVARNQWSRARPMLHGRYRFGSASLNTISIVAGGVDLTGKICNLAEMYNSETDTWEHLPDMTVARRRCTGFFMDGKFYVIGGLNQNLETLHCGEEFNLETRVWRRIEDMYPFVSPLYQAPPLMAVVNNQLYAADKYYGSISKYNKKNNTWDVVTNIPVNMPRDGHGVAFRGCGHRLVVIMGQKLVHNHGVVIYAWRPEGSSYEAWEVITSRQGSGLFVENCAIMGC